MYKAEFDKHIQNKSLSNSFVFFGESSFLIDMYTKMMTNIDDANTLTFYYDEYDFNSAKAHLSQASLFGGNNVLVIKSEKKVNKKELETLVALCEKNQDNVFVYAYYGSDYKAYAKGFANAKTMSVRFFNPKEYEAQNIILSLASQKNINIGKFTVSHLLNTHNADVALAANELDKLAVFDREITTKDIDNVVYGLGEINLEDFMKKLLEKKDITEDLQNILEHGEDEIRILTTLTSYITQLYMFNIYIRVNGTPNALDILGYPAPKFVVDAKAAQAIKIKPQTYYKLHELLLKSELKMKSTHTDKGAILRSSLIKFQKNL
ncbi:DNA polymerase III subunit delta [Sulfurimonas sp.]|uniref:DNA polymerase III subunit delta n=1 Tax=Sulfurimonas sp. TaxID=2022749 RepID=UPI003D1415DF